jgi:phage terminase large subunit GpA-like protein
MTSLAELTADLVDAAWRTGLAPEPAMTVSEWADRHRVLPGATAEPGPWRTSRVPYLREIMDALSTSSAIERVVFMKGSQTGGTEAALNAIGYWITQAPGIILAVWPSIDMVRRNSRTRLEPLIEGTPSIRSRILPAKTKDPGNTISLKEFPGGALMMTGANSATGLRSTAARYLILDEVDGFPGDADEEGDPVALAIQRTVTFRGRRKIFLVSTPTLAGISRIEKAYAESDRRQYFVPCPQCGAFQILEWRGVQWPEGTPTKAYYACAQCGGVIEERDKQALLAAGEWRATAEGDGRTAGFRLSALYSPFETWGEIASELIAAKTDIARFKAWTNLKLGEPFEDRETAALSPDALRREEWGELLPAGVLVITVGVDVQDDRLELEFVGWGLGEESWSLGYELIHGDTSGPHPWEALDRLLAKRFPHGRAVPDMGIAAVAVDSGGHRTDVVMHYSAERLQRRVWAIKGRGGPAVPPWPRRPPKPQRASLAPVHIVGVDTLKATLLARLRSPETTGPAVCHLPADREADWFAGLLAERPVRKWRGGVARIEWMPDRSIRNEPLDCRVYATAALHGLYAAGLSLPDLAKQIGAAPLKSASARAEPDGAASPPPPSQRPATIRSRWLDQ